MGILRTNLAFFFRFLAAFALSVLGSEAQECTESFEFNKQSNPEINWSTIPEFSLPFDNVFGLGIRNNQVQGPLTHGFSHISDESFLSSIPLKNRAQIYYGVAAVNQPQPWSEFRSPWGNDLGLYKNKWIDFGNYFARNYGDVGTIDADIFVFDIERTWRFDHEILALKNNPAIDTQYRNLSNDQFLSRYKSDLRALYSDAVKTTIDIGVSPQMRIGSYADTPIVNTFQNIQGKSWAEWQTDASALNYICTDEQNRVGGAFYDQMDIMTPSAYYYYDYPHLFAPEYLSYLLFQIEANAARSSKPIIPFVWLRYSFNPEVVGTYIRPWMAEATAIFPYFSGAKGQWLWEEPAKSASEVEFTPYLHYINGLYRVSQVKRFFEGEHELVIETSARDYNENKQPIWRGVVKGKEILIAAHNPFAANENEEVIIGVSYKNWSGTVKLKGYETKLCVFDMSILAEEPSPQIILYPNPGSNFVQIDGLNSSLNHQVDFFDIKGKLLAHYELKNKSSERFDISNWPQQKIFVNITNEYFKITKTLIKN